MTPIQKFYNRRSLVIQEYLADLTARYSEKKLSFKKFNTLTEFRILILLYRKRDSKKDVKLLTLAEKTNSSFPLFAEFREWLKNCLQAEEQIVHSNSNGVSAKNLFSNIIMKEIVEAEEVPDTFFSKLPLEITKMIADKLSNQDLSALSYTSRNNFFLPYLNERNLILAAIKGSGADLLQVLEVNNTLIHKKMAINYNGYHFHKISAFQHALWSLNKHAWLMMIEQIPLNQGSVPIWEQLIGQHEEVNEGIIEYDFDDNLGKIYSRKESHYDFAIIEGLTQMKAETDLSDNFDTIWVSKVGLEQRKIPKHIAHMYCGNKPFFGVDDLSNREEIAKVYSTWLNEPFAEITLFYNSCTQQYEDWFSIYHNKEQKMQLGVHYAIFKTYNGEGAMGAEMAFNEGCIIHAALLDNEIAALTALQQDSLTAFKLLPEILQNKLELSKQAEVGNGPNLF